MPDENTHAIAVCEICAREFADPDGPPHLCDPCTKEIEAQQEEQWDAEARALGFASFKERYEFESRLPHELTIRQIGEPSDGAANQQRRIERVIAMLREMPNNQESVFVAGEAAGGLVPVTVGKWRSTCVVSIFETGVVARSWDPVKFLSTINEKSAVTPAERLKAAHVASDICSQALRESEKARRR
jgi:hypothetical protein